MFKLLQHKHKAFVSLLGLLVLPVVVRAEILAFRNDTTAPIVVQAAHFVQGTVQRDKPNLLQPSESCRVNLLGKKLITVYNAKMPNQVFYQGAMLPAEEDRSYSIRLDAKLGKVVVEQVKPPAR